jgi:hypothetical protein
MKMSDFNQSIDEVVQSFDYTDDQIMKLIDYTQKIAVKHNGSIPAILHELITTEEIDLTLKLVMTYSLGRKMQEIDDDGINNSNIASAIEKGIEIGQSVPQGITPVVKWRQTKKGLEIMITGQKNSDQSGQVSSPHVQTGHDQTDPMYR